MFHYPSTPLKSITKDTIVLLAWQLHLMLLKLLIMRSIMANYCFVFFGIV